MNLFEVYPLQDVTIEKAKGSFVWDKEGHQYLDMYGGHAVISIGHTHPHYVQRITAQLNRIGFYSNLRASPCPAHKNNTSISCCSSFVKRSSVSPIKS